MKKTMKKGDGYPCWLLSHPLPDPPLYGRVGDLST